MNHIPSEEWDSTIYSNNCHPVRNLKASILVLLEPSLDNRTYESKYLPLMVKYFNPNSFSIDVVGSSNSIHLLSPKFKKVHSIRIYPQNFHGVNFFLGYILYLLFSFFALIRISKKNNFSVLVSLGGHAYSGLVVSLVSKIIGKKSIVRISEPTRMIVNARYFQGRLMSVFVSLAESISFCLSNVIITNRDMSWYNSQISKKQKILSQGVDTNRFCKVRTKSRPFGFPNLITIARLDRQKNIAAVIEAVSQLKVKYPNISYHIVGWGPDEKSLKDRARILGVDKYVHFYGYAPPEKIPFILNCADFFVFPSLVEGLPSAVLEAMACGLPTILASAPYSCQKSFTNEKTVLIVEGHAKAIADGIKRLVSDDSLRNTISINGRKYVIEQHNCSNTKDRLEDIILHLIS